jgi:transcriptional regulator with XRE-family HTH domain
MEKSLKSPAYGRLIQLLVAARHNAGMSQQAVADLLDQHQSFVAKYEGGERRLDVIEFVTIARALDADPISLLRAFLKAESDRTTDKTAVKVKTRRSPRKA